MITRITPLITNSAPVCRNALPGDSLSFRITRCQRLGNNNGPRPSRMRTSAIAKPRQLSQELLMLQTRQVNIFGIMIQTKPET